MKTKPPKRPLRHLGALVVSASLFAAGCSTSVGGQQPAGRIAPPDTVANPGQTVPTTPAGGGQPGDDSTTTTIAPVPFTLAPVPAEAPEPEVVTITTKDGLDLFARFWEGGDTAVLFTHHPQTQLSGPQDSTSLEPWSFGVIEAGYTVLAPDLRGHGNSPGTAFAEDSKADVAASYQFLVDAGYETIISLAARGSAPIVVNEDVNNDQVDFDGIALLFPPLSRNGNDLLEDLPATDVPIWVVHIDAGSSGGIPNRLGAVTPNLYDAFTFPRVPSGLQFIDVYGEEYMGRILAFLEFAEGASG